MERQTQGQLSMEAGSARKPRPRLRRQAGAAAIADLQRDAGNRAVAGLIGAHPGTGRALDQADRTRLERGLGMDLSRMRLHLDAGLAARHRAVAFTVGDHVVIDPAHYRPGTLEGDALLGHEAAHVAQQRDTAEGGAHEPELEAEADAGARAAVAEQPTGFIPRLRSALSLRRCSSCRATRREIELAERLRSERDPDRLASIVEHATGEQLGKAEQAVSEGTLSADSVQAKAIAWERALRARDFNRVHALGAEHDGLRTAFRHRLHELIMNRRTSIVVEAGDSDLGSALDSAFYALLGIPSGFALVTALLATGAAVTIRTGTEHGTTPVDSGETGRSVYGAAGLEAQPGRGTGSTITINPAMLEGQTTPGMVDGRRELIDMDAATTVGHELIHALNNARGQNLRPWMPVGMMRGITGGVGLVRDPATGTGESPEEQRTITGQTRFQQINPGGAPDTEVALGEGIEVSENDLRRDLGLPQRVSHAGAPVGMTIRRAGETTVDALVARYSNGGAAVDAATAAVIRELLLSDRIDVLLEHMTEASQVRVPHPERIRLHIRYVQQDHAHADRLDRLAVE